MLRVGKECIVTFPNFGHWKARFYLATRGRMPVSDLLPYEWYNTPNIHLATWRDLLSLCRADNILVKQIFPLTEKPLSRLLVKAGFRNLGAERILVNIARP
jgi:methionine biosynthesis protein MetW